VVVEVIAVRHQASANEPGGVQMLELILLKSVERATQGDHDRHSQHAAADPVRMHDIRFVSFQLRILHYTHDTAFHIATNRTGSARIRRAPDASLHVENDGPLPQEGPLHKSKL
jgi:hypothetical protein